MHLVLEARVVTLGEQPGVVGDDVAQRLDPRPFRLGEVAEHVIVHELLDAGILRSWLTPEQGDQWAARGHFEVIGSDTGTRYRITNRAIMSAQPLDEAGRPVKQWCFAPVGDVASADVLLAQKIALETVEREALALANSQRLRV
jgi:hypothetical protein